MYSCGAASIHLLQLLILASPCSSQGFGAGAEAEHQPVEESRTLFRGYQVDGLALYRLVYPVPQGMTDVSSSILIIGIDSDGREVRGGELFRRCGLLSAEEMAMRAIDILLARNGAQWLVPGALPSYVHAFGNGDITLPFIRNDSLFFWIAEGDLVPTATRIMVDLSTGHFQRLSDSHE